MTRLKKLERLAMDLGGLAEEMRQGVAPPLFDAIQELAHQAREALASPSDEPAGVLEDVIRWLSLASPLTSPPLLANRLRDGRWREDLAKCPAASPTPAKPPGGTGTLVEVGSTWKRRGKLMGRFERVRVTGTANDIVSYDAREDSFKLGATSGSLPRHQFVDHYEPDATPWDPPAEPTPSTPCKRGEADEV